MTKFWSHKIVWQISLSLVSGKILFHTSTSTFKKLVEYDQFFIAQNILTNFSKLGVRQNIISDMAFRFTSLVELMTNFVSHKIFWQSFLSLEPGKLLFQTCTWRFYKISRVDDQFLIVHNNLTNFSKLGVSQNFISDKYLQVYKISRIYDQFLIMQNILTNFSKLGVRNFFFLHTSTSRSTNLLKLMTNFQLCKIFWQFSLSLESSKILFQTSTSSFAKWLELMTNILSHKIFW